MSRLIHSLAGFRRSLQISRTTVFILIEGWSDRYFYGRIAENVCRAKNISYEIKTAEEVQQTGGKSALIKCYDYLKRSSSLSDEFKGKKTIVLLYLDKDLDDFLRARKRSPHVVYTEYYELENHLYRAGDLIEAASAASSLEANGVCTGLTNRESWLARNTNAWKEWVKICFFARRYNVQCECNYSRNASPIHHGFNSILDETAHRASIQNLQIASGFEKSKFERLFRNSSKVIDKLYKEGKQDLVFKGKWHSGFLCEDIKEMAHGRSYRCQALPERLESCLGMSLNVSEPWADHFKQPLANLITNL